jgi:sugar lactone lactonase YvrE
VSRWDPETGRCLATVTVPVPLVTSCAFGGSDLATLYITTARSDLTPARLAEAPASGGLFVCRPGVTGIPACSFAG